MAFTATTAQGSDGFAVRNGEPLKSRPPAKNEPGVAVAPPLVSCPRPVEGPGPACNNRLRTESLLQDFGIKRAAVERGANSAEHYLEA